MNYKKLIEVHKLVKELEFKLTIKKREFEESIVIDKALYEDLLDKETKLKEEAILTLEKDNKISEKVDGHIISRSIKVTKQIENTIALMSSIIYNAKKIIPLIDIGKVDLNDYLNENVFQTELVIKDKKAVNEIIDKYEKVEGKLLDGVKIKETKFITIKN